MTKKGLQNGDESTVVLYLNRRPIGELVIQTISTVEVAVSSYWDDDETLLILSEQLKAALSAVNYALQKPRLQDMLRERIAELRRLEAEVEEDDPPDQSDLKDIPF